MPHRTPPPPVLLARQYRSYRFVRGATSFVRVEFQHDFSSVASWLVLDVVISWCLDAAWLSQSNFYSSFVSIPLSSSLPVLQLQQGHRPRRRQHHRGCGGILPNSIQILHHEMRRRYPPRPLVPLGSSWPRLLIRLRRFAPGLPSLSSGLRYLSQHPTRPLSRTCGRDAHHCRISPNGRRGRCDGWTQRRRRDV